MKPWLSYFYGVEQSGSRARYTKAEHLKSEKAIEALFKEGRTLKRFPLLVVYSFFPSEQKPLIQAGFSVSKRRFRSAVDRNRIKRLMREAYRLQKSGLYERLAENPVHIQMMFIFSGNELPDFPLVALKISELIERLSFD